MRLALFAVILAACGGHRVDTVLLTPQAGPAQVVSRQSADVRVHFEGMHNVPEKLFRDAVLVVRLKKSASASDGEEAVVRDELFLAAVLYDHGYIKGKVTSDTSVAPDGTLDVTYRIEEGERFRLRAVTLRERDASTPLGAVHRARAGEWFSRRTLVEDLTEIRTLYLDAGYAFVEAEPETNIDPEKRTIDVDIVVNRGPIVSYEQIDALPQAFAPTILAATSANGVAAGLRYDDSKLHAAKRALAAQNVDVVISTHAVEGKPDRVVVVFERQQP